MPMAAKFHSAGRDAEITLPKWAWGIICALAAALLGVVIASAAWGFQYGLETRSRTDANTSEIHHVREWYQRIEAQQDRMEAKIDKLLENRP